jgi:hypothetical protein
MSASEADDRRMPNDTIQRQASLKKIRLELDQRGYVVAGIDGRGCPQRGWYALGSGGWWIRANRLDMIIVLAHQTMASALALRRS